MTATEPIADDTANASPVARIRELQIEFTRGGRPARAVKDVTLDIFPGEILAVAGESGSGKSVLGLSLLGLLRGNPPPRITGAIEVAGVDVLHASPKQLRKLRAAHLGAVFQDPMTSLTPTMTIGAQLAEVSGNKDKSVELLRDVGVPDPDLRVSSYPHQMSGGQRQRVMLAMAVARNPSLLVADEPTTALDVTVQAQVLNLLLDLRARTGTSVLFITHDLGVAAQVADRVAVMYAGRIVEVGTASDVLERPQHPYTRDLLRSRLALDTDLGRPVPQLRGEMPPVTTELRGCAYGPRCSFHTTDCDEQVPPLVPAQGTSVAACIRLSELSGIESEAEPVSALVSTEHTEPELVLTNVQVAFSTRRGWGPRRTLQALRGVDLDVSRGECVALVGESGCGKSTLLRVVAGLQQQSHGSVSVRSGGYPQMVFQDAGASLTPWLTAEQLVGERLRAAGLRSAERSARIDEAMRLVGLPVSMRRAKPPELSGGQRQRLAFARAIAVTPPVLLADEPTSALDVSLAAMVLNLIGTLRRELDMAVVFVTHDIAAARIVADRIAVMYLGRIVEEGPAGDIIATPQHPYTQALLAAVPSLDEKQRPVRGEPASPLHPPSGCAYHPRCPVRIDSCDTDDPPLLALLSRPDRLAACVHAETVSVPNRGDRL
jgi:peptide/nickel transport system ATP-binding protein